MVTHSLPDHLVFFVVGEVSIRWFIFGARHAAAAASYICPFAAHSLTFPIMCPLYHWCMDSLARSTKSLIFERWFPISILLELPLHWVNSLQIRSVVYGLVKAFHAVLLLHRLVVSARTASFARCHVLAYTVSHRICRRRLELTFEHSLCALHPEMLRSEKVPDTVDTRCL